MDLGTGVSNGGCGGTAECLSLLVYLVEGLLDDGFEGVLMPEDSGLVARTLDGWGGRAVDGRHVSESGGGVAFFELAGGGGGEGAKVVAFDGGDGRADADVVDPLVGGEGAERGCGALVGAVEEGCGCGDAAADLGETGFDAGVEVCGRPGIGDVGGRSRCVDIEGSGDAHGEHCKAD